MAKAADELAARKAKAMNWRMMKLAVERLRPRSEIVTDIHDVKKTLARDQIFPAA